MSNLVRGRKGKGQGKEEKGKWKQKARRLKRGRRKGERGKEINKKYIYKREGKEGRKGGSECCSEMLSNNYD